LGTGRLTEGIPGCSGAAAKLKPLGIPQTFKC
jgi:hypothetical protein